MRKVIDKITNKSSPKMVLLGTPDKAGTNIELN